MKRSTLLCLALAVTFLPGMTRAPCQEAPKALLFIRGGSADWEYMLRQEASVMVDILEEAGVQVDVATASGDPIRVGSIDYTPDLSLADADPSAYDALVMPCMAASGFVDPGAVRVVGEMAASGKIIAAQYNAITTVAVAGLLKGKRYAFRTELDPERHPAYEGARYAGGGVVRDGNLITSGICPYMARARGVPDQTAEFAVAVAEAIKGMGG